MPYPVPTSLSPSRVESFTSCPLAFRFSSIEKLPEPPSPHATKGTIVHRALELLLTREPVERTAAAAHQDLGRAVEELREDPDFAHLDLTPEEEAEFVADAHVLVDAYLALEDPAAIRPMGLELQLEAQVGGLLMRGIIDRLEEDADGDLVVVDYKTGRSPPVQYEQGRLGGVHFYAYLCEQALGRRPSIIRLMYLRDGIIIEARPTDRSVRFLPKRTEAVWRAIARACETGDFKPRPGRLCPMCAFQDWCPAFGGDADRAGLEAPVRYGRGPVQLPLDASTGAPAITAPTMPDPLLSA